VQELDAARGRTAESALDGRETLSTKAFQGRRSASTGAATAQLRCGLHTDITKFVSVLS